MEQTTATAVDPKADRIRTFITHQLGAAIARHGDDFSDFDPGEILCFEDIEGEEIYISPWFKLKAGRHRCPVGRVGSGECRGADGGLGMTATDDAPSGGPLEGMALLAEIATDVGRLVKLVADGAGPAEHEALFAAIDPLDTDDVKAYLYAAVLAIATLRHTAEDRERSAVIDGQPVELVQPTREMDDYRGRSVCAPYIAAAAFESIFWMIPSEVMDDDDLLPLYAAKLERKIGHACNSEEVGAGSRKKIPVYLDELAPDRGDFKADQPSCSFTCASIADELGPVSSREGDGA